MKSIKHHTAQFISKNSKKKKKQKKNRGRVGKEISRSIWEQKHIFFYNHNNYYYSTKKEEKKEIKM